MVTLGAKTAWLELPSNPRENMNDKYYSNESWVTSTKILDDSWAVASGTAYNTNDVSIV